MRWCGAVCAASSSTSAPFWWAFLTTSSTGMLTPSRLEVEPSETSFTPCASSFSISVQVEGVVGFRGHDAAPGCPAASWPSSARGSGWSCAPCREISTTSPALQAQRICHQVDPLGGVAREDHLFLARGVEQFGAMPRAWSTPRVTSAASWCMLRPLHADDFR